MAKDTIEVGGTGEELVRAIYARWKELGIDERPVMVEMVTEWLAQGKCVAVYGGERIKVGVVDGVGI